MAQSELQDVIKKQQVPARVFVSPSGTPIDLSKLTKRWRRLLTQAKLPGFRLYDLRHTFATELLAQE